MVQLYKVYGPIVVATFKGMVSLVPPLFHWKWHVGRPIGHVNMSNEVTGCHQSQTATATVPESGAVQTNYLKLPHDTQLTDPTSFYNPTM